MTPDQVRSAAKYPPISERQLELLAQIRRDPPRSQRHQGA
jgi:hypothetical protein